MFLNFDDVCAKLRTVYTAKQKHVPFSLRVVTDGLNVKCSVLLYVVDHYCLILVFLDPNKHADTNTPAAPAVMLTDLLKTICQL